MARGIDDHRLRRTVQQRPLGIGGASISQRLLFDLRNLQTAGEARLARDAPVLETRFVTSSG